MVRILKQNLKLGILDQLIYGGIGASGKEPTCQHRRHKRCGFDPWVGRIPWRRKWQPTLVFLPGESHGQEPGGLWSTGSQRIRHTHKKESDTTERLSMNSQEKGGRRQGEGEELKMWSQLRSFSLIPQGAEEHKMYRTFLKSRKLISVSHCHCSILQ